LLQELRGIFSVLKSLARSEDEWRPYPLTR